MTGPATESFSGTIVAAVSFSGAAVVMIAPVSPAQRRATIKEVMLMRL